MDERIRRFELQYIDRPIDDALIDRLTGSIRTFLGTLKSIVGYSIEPDYDYDWVDAFSRAKYRSSTTTLQAVGRAHHQHRRDDSPTDITD